MSKARKIVDENFKGLKELIKDDEIFEWYKELIVTCMKEYHKLKKKI